MTQDYIGVDVSARKIDIFDAATGAASVVGTTHAELRRFAGDVGTAIVVLEASGGYERPLLAALEAAGAAHVRVNPRQARDFARATGRLAKTDRVDARMLAGMGKALALQPAPYADRTRARLAELVGRRDDLVAMRTAERTRAGQMADPGVRRDIAAHLRYLDRRIAWIEAEIEATIAGDETLSLDAARLCTVPGIGPRLAPALLASLPELGRTCRRSIAALAGVAPLACDSGQFRGKRRIWGGRATARRALYLAAFVQGRHDPAMTAYRDRLLGKGKPFKVANTACARRLLTIINAMIRDGKDYQPQCS